MIVNAILLAAGVGLRLKSKLSKPLIRIAGKEMILYSLLVLEKHHQISGITVVVNPANRQAILRLIKRYRLKKVEQVVLGGARRQDSVRNGLAKLKQCQGLVLIHDSGRPFINEKLLSALINKAAKSKAAVLAVPLKATIKAATKNLEVCQTLKRDLLWEIQTPQVFEYSLIKRAFRAFGKFSVTDDSSLVEKTGAKVYLVKGSYANIKVTTAEDILIAESLAKKGKRLWNIK
ncbi:MAG: 2-C-methyl-D-erythritol 4-phosphate cytidylyltransferase [Candidatus Omnitrophica bacterium]|jgi:2-C-methyl-D-erythritol 4-phosphate cytidylyltransferase|nr:2-C-methyl-D-erythritol 4-phosphate cytidylyltransferase [Candidatus Omnitrophota bacterium]